MCDQGARIGGSRGDRAGRLKQLCDQDLGLGAPGGERKQGIWDFPRLIPGAPVD